MLIGRGQLLRESETSRSPHVLHSTHKAPKNIGIKFQVSEQQAAGWLQAGR